jgi:TRAP-type C4-dicarboxylate transport system substrate-binding protein
MTSTLIKLALAAGLVLGTVAPAVAADTVTLRMTTMSPGGSRNAKIWFGPWAERINAAANGAIKVEVVEGYNVANLQNIYERLNNDVVQIGWVIHSLIGGKFPLTEVAGLPFLADRSEPLAVALWRLYKSGALDSEYDEMMPLGLDVFAQSQIHFTKPRKNLDDLSGLKISSSSRVQTVLIGKLGATPLNMPPSDFYESLQRGVVDATMTSWAAFAPFKLQEVTFYHLEAPFGAGTNGFLMTRKKYNSLPAAARKALDENSGEALTRQFGKFMDGESDLMRNPVAADPKKHTIVHLTPDQLAKWKPKVDAVIADWVAQNPARGPLLAKFREILAQVQAGH